MPLFKIAPEGLPYVIVTAILTIAVFFIGKPWMILFPFALFVFMEFFFRDPERTIPEDVGIFVSPADGKITCIRDIREDEYINDEVKQISIFMSAFNVHVNRVPCDGKVEVVKHTPGGFKAAYKDEASMSNENIAMVLNTEHGIILVRQIAGLLARRAVCRVNPGKFIKRGQRYGIIKFGSRIDLYLPKDVHIRVMVGQKVRAGETTIASINSGSKADDIEN